MISIENVSKSFNRTPAVIDLSVTLDQGEIFGLVGPNGAGKTTTIRMLTGLLSPDKGRILIGGHDITVEPEKAKSLFGYVPDKGFLYDKLTARELLIFTASIYGLGKKEATQRIDNLLSVFGINDCGNDLIEGFSQGMRQRLLFAAALVHSPAMLFIDEPFVGLDPFGVRMLKAEIREMSARGVSLFLATHSLHIAQELCHRVGFIRKGSLISIKSREEIGRVEGGLEELFLQISG
ncbi:MAG: ABC transporter ATP-binding protein [Nitrospirae bacterium]|nr:ABC transporter ATP-binding protein [Nitrospirota bacterium]